MEVRLGLRVSGHLRTAEEEDHGDDQKAPTTLVPVC